MHYLPNCVKTYVYIAIDFSSDSLFNTCLASSTVCSMEYTAITPTAAAALFRAAERGVSKRGAAMTLEERVQLCKRLMTYAESIGKPSNKLRALSRVRGVLDKLKTERLQQKFANEARLNEVNLHNVQTMIGMLETCMIGCGYKLS